MKKNVLLCCEESLQCLSTLVRFGQPETETEEEEPETDGQRRTEYELARHKRTKSSKRKRNSKKGIIIKAHCHLTFFFLNQ